MKVQLIYYTGMPDPDFAAKLLIYTKNTRLTQGEDTRRRLAAMDDEQTQTELDYIANTIRSSWEMIEYVFEITGVTRAFTHQFVRHRHGSYAQQAQRVVNMSDFETLIPQTVVDAGKENTWRLCMEMIASVYKDLQEAGVPTQDCRGVLPTNVLTNIIAKFNLRSLAEIFPKRKNLRAQGEFAEVAREMERCVLEVHPWAKTFLNPERTSTPELDAIMKDLIGDNSPIDHPRINAALKQIDMLKATWG